jgi:hypothetical protein
MGMKDDHRINSKMDDMLFLLVENALDQEGIERIEKWLSTDPNAKSYYLNFIKDYVGMKQQAGSIIDMNEDCVSIHDEYDAELWSALAEAERAAESVPVCKPQPFKPQLIQKVERKQGVHTLSRLSVATFIVSAAAILAMVLFLRLSPKPNVEVATLTDSVEAVFAGNQSLSKGSRLSNRTESLWLQKGVIKIEFDYGAEVVIEGPSEFVLEAADGLTLRSGRLHAYVPGRSKGFSVDTPMASIIDLGTEFAVKVDFDGASEVHMFKGKASLIPGAKGEASGNSQILTVDQARRVDSAGTVNEIAVRENDFVRDIDSQTGFVWRGHTTVNLADIVGGGNGFGTGRLETGINPETGVTAYRDRNLMKNSKFQGFQAVKDNPFVDGVFCPYNDDAMIQVSTQEHFFKACPLTSGTHWGYIMNSGWYGQSSAGSAAFNGDLSLGGQVYGSKEHPSITIHSSMGITFNLQAIRDSLGLLTIERFTARCGISELVLQQKNLPQSPQASFFVLLDGEAVFEKQDITPFDGPVPIDVKIPQEAKFLTLLVTEGSDKTYDGDWTLFAEPKLHLLKTDD